MALGDFIKQVSIHGKRLYLTSTGGIANDSSFVAVMRNATGVVQDKIRSYVETISSSGSVLVNYGLSIISSATGQATFAHTIAAPVAGITKSIFQEGSATTVTFGTSATTILFRSTASAGSTLMTFSSTNGLGGTAVTLIGLSATRWGITEAQGVVTLP